jgi:hypothetical protein
LALVLSFFFFLEKAAKALPRIILDDRRNKETKIITSLAHPNPLPAPRNYNYLQTD